MARIYPFLADFATYFIGYTLSNSTKIITSKEAEHYEQSYLRLSF